MCVMYINCQTLQEYPGHTYTGLWQLLVVLEDSVFHETEDTCHHGRQKDYNDDGVDETEPLHVVLRGGAQDVVPTRRPVHVIIYLMEETESLTDRGKTCSSS